MLNVVMLNVIMLSVVAPSGHYGECHYAECHYAECHYGECRYAECHYAECLYAECHYAECRSAVWSQYKALRSVSIQFLSPYIFRIFINIVHNYSIPVNCTYCREQINESREKKNVKESKKKIINIQRPYF